MAVDRMVKACHKCKQYIELGNTYESMQKEHDFDQKHRGHPLQVVRLSEIQNYYKPV
ncbi:MAG: hypothetical protein ACFFD2_05910 [Promethearchaeota archaeon]